MVNSKIINLKWKSEYLAVLWYGNLDILAC